MRRGWRKGRMGTALSRDPHLFPLANLGFLPDVGDVCTGTRGNNMFLTMGNIPSSVGGERVLTYGGISIDADAYRCGDTGTTMGVRTANGGGEAGQEDCGGRRASARVNETGRGAKRIGNAPGDGPHRVDATPLEQEGDNRERLVPVR
ncbi:hypothetical protein B0H14DRAFT_2618068 [Mycena olivaceomarginata]|nr:hypothetical protein B0H14DRAFT_2618068 [Mycena olivaceomarginata]